MQNVKKTLQKLVRATVSIALLLSLTACAGWMGVGNPNDPDSSTLDPGTGEGSGSSFVVLPVGCQPSGWLQNVSGGIR